LDFIDSALIRLADPTTRPAMFDNSASEHMTGAAYDAAALSLSGPYSPVFEKVTLGLSVAFLGVVQGVIRSQSGGPSSEVDIQLGGLGPLLPARVDALWYGCIVARVLPADGHINAVRAKFAVDDIDADIVKDLGVLPRTHRSARTVWPTWPQSEHSSNLRSAMVVSSGNCSNGAAGRADDLARRFPNVDLQSAARPVCLT
jgi:hypothetical protein